MDKGTEIYLINKNISEKLLHFSNRTDKIYYIDFENYHEIELALKDTPTPALTIYDQTNTPDPIGTIYPVNDHINRIGHNPFIGHQKQFKIDFINIENIYIQHPKGIITDSCGPHPPYGPYPSSYLANVAALAYIFKYKIKGFLINI